MLIEEKRANKTDEFRKQGRREMSRKQMKWKRCCKKEIWRGLTFWELEDLILSIFLFSSQREREPEKTKATTSPDNTNAGKQYPQFSHKTTTSFYLYKKITNPCSNYCYSNTLCNIPQSFFSCFSSLPPFLSQPITCLLACSIWENKINFIFFTFSLSFCVCR